MALKDLLSLRSSHQNPEKWLLQESGVEPRFGYCVIDTLQSLATELSGRQITVAPEQREARTKQMKDTIALVDKRFAAFPEDSENIIKMIATQTQRLEMQKKLEPVVMRLDLMTFERFVKSLQRSDSPIGQVLRDCELQFTHGNLDKIRIALQEGWSVAIASPVVLPNKTVSVHVFHAGIDENQNIIDKSDTAETTNESMVTVIQDMQKKGLLEQAILLMHQITKGNNLLFIRKKAGPTN